MKNGLIIMGVVVVAFCFLIGCRPIQEPKEPTVIITDEIVFEPVDRAGNPIADRGCCTTGDTCASGVGVTKEYCAETGGTFEAGKECAEVGNNCE